MNVSSTAPRKLTSSRSPVRLRPTGAHAGRCASWLSAWSSWTMLTRSPTRPCARRSKKNALHPHRRRMWCIPEKPSAEFVFHLEDVLEVYHRPHDPKRPVVCVDETSYEDRCVKSVLFSAVRHRSFPRVLASVGA